MIQTNAFKRLLKQGIFKAPSSSLGDKIFGILLKFGAFFVVFLLMLLLFVLIYKASTAIKEFGLGFLFSSEWDANLLKFGAAPAILGTLFSAFLAIIIATPIAFLIAIFLSFIAPKELRFIGVLIELLAAIPSIVYGMWGFLYLVPLMSVIIGGSGMGLISGGLVLSLMILPFILVVAKNAFECVPNDLKEAAFALGATRLDLIRDVIFSYCKNALFGGVILALSRAFGETMAVAFLLGGIMKFSLNEPSSSIPVVLATQFGEMMGSGLGESVMFYLALILMILSFGITSLAKFVFKLGSRK